MPVPSAVYAAAGGASPPVKFHWAIGVPTTVMVGTQDRTTPPRLSEQIAQAVPGARLVRCEGRGHMLPLEAPDDIVAEIERLRG